jgi:hypothetical protein
MPTLTNTHRRVLAALALLVFLTSGANYQFALHMFGRFDKPALILAVVFMFVVVHFLKPDMSKRRPTFSWGPVFLDRRCSDWRNCLGCLE